MSILKKAFTIFVLFVVIAGAGGAAWYFDFFGLFESNTATEQKKENQAANPVDTTPKKVQIAATGDIMMHDWQIIGGKQEDGTYDFSHFFPKIKPYLSKADVAIGNFEFTLRGKEPYKGYPLFNAPDSVVDALKDAGMDMVSTANNHSMDGGVEGVKRTYRVLNEKGILTNGTAPSKEERKPTIFEKNGIKIAFISYTEMTNGIPVPKSYLVNQIKKLKQLKEDIATAKEQGAEFIMVALHFGEEYLRSPNEYQRKVAKEVLESGADVIIGNHPHVLQRMEKVNMDGKDKLIIYSLGNFISYQVKEHTDESAIVYFDIVKDSSGKVQVGDVSFLPILTYKKRYHVEVVPMTSEEKPDEFDDLDITKKKWRTSYKNIVEVLNRKQEFPLYSAEKASGS